MTILIIQLRRIGDVILTTPAVAAIKKRYPAASIDFLVEKPGAEILAGNPHIRKIHVYDASHWAQAAAEIKRIRALRYDWVIDYMGNPRTALLSALSGAAIKAGPAHVFHRWSYNTLLRQSETACYAGLEKIKVLAPLGVPSDNADFLPAIYLDSKPQPEARLIAFAPASRRATRRWPAASYARLGRLLRREYGCDILIFWGPGERELAEEIVRGIGPSAKITPETKTLGSAASLMARCRLLITNCNGPKHIAVALGVPTVTIHGSSDPISWNPPHPNHLVARLDNLFCIACGLNRCPYHLECMTQLSAERVMALAAILLGKTPLPTPCRERLNDD